MRPGWLAPVAFCFWNEGTGSSEISEFHPSKKSASISLRVGRSCLIVSRWSLVASQFSVPTGRKFPVAITLPGVETAGLLSGVMAGRE